MNLIFRHLKAMMVLLVFIPFSFGVAEGTDLEKSAIKVTLG